MDAEKVGYANSVEFRKSDNPSQERTNYLKKATVVYFTNTDITGQLVQATIDALHSKGVKADSHRILGAEIIECRFQNKSLFNNYKTCF